MGDQSAQVLHGGGRPGKSEDMKTRSAYAWLGVSVALGASLAGADGFGLPVKPVKIDTPPPVTIPTVPALAVPAAVSQAVPSAIKGAGALVIPGRDFGMRKGDVIQEIDGLKVADGIQGQERLLKEGAKIQVLKVKRAGKILTLKRKLLGDPR